MGVVLIGDGGEARDEAAAFGSEGDGLGAAIGEALFAGDEMLAQEAIDKLGDGSASEAGGLGESAGRGRGGVEHLAEDDPFGDGDAAGEEFASEGLGDVIGVEA